MPRLDAKPLCRLERMPMGLRRPASPGGAGSRITSDIQMRGDRCADRAVRSAIRRLKAPVQTVAPNLRRTAARGRVIMRGRPTDSLAALSGVEGRRLLSSKTCARRGQRNAWGKS